jgi:hypothetical protein
VGITVREPPGERRVDARFRQAALAPTRATLRPGCDVTVIDLSAGGALVQARRPLRPGARVHLQLATLGRMFALSAHVLRCAVWSLDGEDGVIYRGALQFEHRCVFVREEPARRGYVMPSSSGPESSARGTPLPVRREPTSAGN